MNRPTDRIESDFFFFYLFDVKPTIRFVIDAHLNSAELRVHREGGREAGTEREGRFSVKITHAETHAHRRERTRPHARTQAHAAPLMD